jgi:hypothetical protein
MVKPAFRKYIMYQRYARRYLMESDEVFYCTRSERNIFYFYCAARKYLYLFIPDPFLNILTNLQFKISRLTAGSASITEGVVTQLARDLDFRIRRVEKEARGVSLSEVEDSFSLENIFHFHFHAVKRGVKLFAEIINLSL